MDLTSKFNGADCYRLAGWANDEWHYVVVIVTDITDDEDAETDYVYALWGVESMSDEYIAEVAHELTEGSNRDTCRTIEKVRADNRFRVAMELGV